VSQLSDTQVVTASGGLVELGYSQVTADINVTSTTAGSGTQIIAPLTVVCDGGPVLVEFFTPRLLTSTVSGSEIHVSLYQDGSEKIRYFALFNTPAGVAHYATAKAEVRLTPTAGSHTFGITSFVTSTTGTPFVGAGTGAATTVAPAFLRVSKIVQAQQWPAVTTGTIICTSATRPSAPFVGQQIYETDTSLNYQWTGAAWTVRNADQTAWTTPSLLNSWVFWGSPYQVPRYMKDSSGVVHVEGLVKNGTIGLAVINLPAGHRPIANRIVATSTNSNAYGQIIVDTAGNVIATAGSNTWFSINTSFRASA